MPTAAIATAIAIPHTKTRFARGRVGEEVQPSFSTGGSCGALPPASAREVRKPRTFSFARSRSLSVASSLVGRVRLPGYFS